MTPIYRQLINTRLEEQYKGGVACPSGYTPISSSSLLDQSECKKIVNTDLGHICHPVAVTFGWYDYLPSLRTFSRPFEPALKLEGGQMVPYREHRVLPCQPYSEELIWKEWAMAATTGLGIMAGYGVFKYIQYRIQQAALANTLKKMLMTQEYVSSKFFNGPIEYFVYTGSASEVKFYLNKLIKYVNLLSIPGSDNSSYRVMMKCKEIISHLTYSIHRARNGSLLARFIDIFVFYVCGLNLSLAEAMMSHIGEAEALCRKLMKDVALQQKIGGIKPLHLTTPTQKRLWHVLTTGPLVI